MLVPMGRTEPPRKWFILLDRMKGARTPDELRGKFGAPLHREVHESKEIWHYPLGVIDGMLYSIHAIIQGDQIQQVYHYVAPTNQPDTVSLRPWWRLW